MLVPTSASNPRAGRSSSRAPGERDTWRFIFMADNRSRVLPGASSCLRKVTIPHRSAGAAFSPDNLRGLGVISLSLYRVRAILSSHNVLISQHSSHACKVRHADTKSPCCLPQDRHLPPCRPNADPGTQPFDLQGLMGDLAGVFGRRIDFSPCSQGGADREYRLSGPGPRRRRGRRRRPASSTRWCKTPSDRSRR